MKYEQYKEAVTITLAELGSKEKNVEHMIHGMNGEIGEIIEAIRKGDIVNLGEELTDHLWFFTNYCNLHGFFATNYFLELDKEKKSIRDYFINLKTFRELFVRGYYFITRNPKKVLRHPLYFTICLEDLIIETGKLTDLEKKQSCYGKVQEDSSREEILVMILIHLVYCYYFAGLDIETCMQNNIDKLMVRYNKKKFDKEQAIKRDLEAERRELEK